MYTVETHARGRERIHSSLPLLLGYGALRADSVFFLFPLWWPQILCHSTELHISWVPNKGGWQTSSCESISAWELFTYVTYRVKIRAVGRKKTGISNQSVLCVIQWLMFRISCCFSSPRQHSTKERFHDIALSASPTWSLSSIPKAPSLCYVAFSHLVPLFLYLIFPKEADPSSYLPFHPCASYRVRLNKYCRIYLFLIDWPSSLIVGGKKENKTLGLQIAIYSKVKT